jgi:Holliday junction resolvase RusA-like endonuclease
VSADGAPGALDVTLPDVVSWARPRRWGTRLRYPAAYAAGRATWAAAVAHAVAERGWDPPVRARYWVAVAVCGGGRRDLDRVCTAVLDALQGGGAVRDDCLVDVLTAGRFPVPPGDAPATLVHVATLSDAPPASTPGRKPGARARRPESA